ncbi:MAG: GNAT family N-acetyltransferase [Deltaproteobacteria bacterium]|nr:GNAT family N-acetyltransferase [Deltaproteobacteria bacterium]
MDHWRSRKNPEGGVGGISRRRYILLSPASSIEGKVIHVRRLGPQPADQPAEWTAVREICCRTGNDGKPVAGERWNFFARLWIEPYEKICPGWTYIAEGDGAIVGYLTGCPDTRAFARKKLWRFTFPLLWNIARGAYPDNKDAGRFLRQFFYLDRETERGFPRRFRSELKRFYPAHLHINVQAEWRGLGIGKRLVDHFRENLKSVGVAGVHLYCGERPVKFYLKIGFSELARVEFHGRPVFALSWRPGDPTLDRPPSLV